MIQYISGLKDRILHYGVPDYLYETRSTYSNAKVIHLGSNVEGLRYSINFSLKHILPVLYQ